MITPSGSRNCATLLLAVMLVAGPIACGIYEPLDTAGYICSGVTDCDEGQTCQQGYCVVVEGVDDQADRYVEAIAGTWTVESVNGSVQQWMECEVGNQWKLLASGRFIISFEHSRELEQSSDDCIERLPEVGVAPYIAATSAPEIQGKWSIGRSGESITFKPDDGNWTTAELRASFSGGPPTQISIVHDLSRFYLGSPTYRRTLVREPTGGGSTTSSNNGSTHSGGSCLGDIETLVGLLQPEFPLLPSEEFHDCSELFPNDLNLRSTCISDFTGLTVGCAQCFVSYDACALEYCSAECRRGPDGVVLDEDLCRSCVEVDGRSCSSDLEVCSGLPF